MKIHLNQIPHDGLHVEGTEPSKVLDLHERSIQPVSDIQYSLDMGLSDGGLFAIGAGASRKDERLCALCDQHAGGR